MEWNGIESINVVEEDGITNLLILGLAKFSSLELRGQDMIDNHCRLTNEVTECEGMK